MDDETPESKPEVHYEQSRTQAKRAQLGLNILVVLSAVSGAAFLSYVLVTIRPFGKGEAPGVNIPTSTVAERLGVLQGEDLEAGLFILLRDIDEAPEYRDKLSERMRADLGIAGEGRLYLLIVRNHGQDSATFNGDRLVAHDKDGATWNLRWLSQVADAESANAVGRMRLAQSGHSFELPAGAERQLYVFAGRDSSGPPSAESFIHGEVRLESGRRIALEHIDLKVAEQ